ncbi:hypothetical protein, partial [Megasphaera massiliensis]|uniref:hypothetical protein n=1 Tax=Megasphaera massiliensis TaxID=1232428 RepID=UPI003AB1A97C
MDLKFFMTYYIMFPLIILWLVKSFILKKFLFALLYSIYVNIYAFSLEIMKTSLNLLSGAFLLWFSVIVYARCKFFRIHNQKRDAYIDVFL